MNLGMKLMFLVAMIFMHIVDDYYLQGKLAELKQKLWWENQRAYWEQHVPNCDYDKYKYDYIVALICHGFSWSVMVHTPMAIYFYLIGELSIASYALVGSIIAQASIHSFIDDLKANKFKINLIDDQLLHLIQIMYMFIMILARP